jgi:hypothetical protein
MNSGVMQSSPVEIFLDARVILQLHSDPQPIVYSLWCFYERSYLQPPILAARHSPY